MANVVLWSGGADSTFVLHQYAGVSCEDYPVRAFSVCSHPYLSKPFMRAQESSKRNYLKLAKRRKYHIRYERFLVGGNWSWGKIDDSFGHSTEQTLVWVSSLVQALNHGDTVLLGYIRGDCFWHIRNKFEAAFRSLCDLKGVSVSLKYPVEYNYKSDILLKLKEEKVSDSCWFSCEDTQDGKPCGVCSCCIEIADARSSRRYDKKYLQCF